MAELTIKITQKHLRTAAIAAGIIVMTMGLFLITRSVQASKLAKARADKEAHSGQSARVSSLPSNNIRQILESSDGHFLYAVTSDGLFRSTDGGKTWNNTTQNLTSPSGASLNSYAAKAQIDDSGKIWLNVGFGLYRSDDHGETWHQVAPATAFVSDFAVSELYVALVTHTNQLVLFHSSDLEDVIDSSGLNDAWSSPAYKGTLPAANDCAGFTCVNGYLNPIGTEILYYSPSGKAYFLHTNEEDTLQPTSNVTLIWNQLHISKSSDLVSDGYSNAPFTRNPGIFLALGGPSATEVMGFQSNGKILDYGALDQNAVTSVVLPEYGEAFAYTIKNGKALVEELRDKANAVTLDGDTPNEMTATSIMELDMSHMLIGTSDSGLYLVSLPPNFLQASHPPQYYTVK